MPNTHDVAQQYRANGYVVLRDVFDRCEVARLGELEESVVRPCTAPLLRHDGRHEPHAYYEAPGLTPLERSRCGLLHAHAMKEGPIQGFVDELGRFLASPAMFRCLNALDGNNRYTLHQTIFFFTSPLTVPHLDYVSLDTMPMGASFTVWVPIDEVTEANGPPFVVPNPVGRYESAETLRLAPPGSEENPKFAFQNALKAWMREQRKTLVVPLLAPGDALIFAPSTLHGSFPARDAGTRRRSMQCIFRPTRYSRWGAYPDSDQPHSVEHEEYEVGNGFNFLRFDYPRRETDAGRT